MILGDFILGDDLLSSHFFSGTWEGEVSFTYLEGATVILTPTLSAFIPEGTSIAVYAGERSDDLTLCPDGEATGLSFVDASSGATDILVRIVFTSAISGVVPTLISLGLFIQQSTSLYTVARQILESGLSGTGAEYYVDPELQKYLVSYSWVKSISHRKVLAKVAQACGGAVYQDRYEIIRVEAGDYITRMAETASVDTINEDRIYDASSPVSEVKNVIRITTKPYEPQTTATVWELSGDKTINAGQQRAFDIKYSDYDAVIDGAVVMTSVPSGATIISETHYANGAHVVVQGSADGQVLTMSVTAKPLAAVGSVVVERSDGASIRRNGEQILVIDDNDLIQNEVIAGMIADDILAMSKDESREGEFDWRGDPTIEINDPVTIEGFGKAVIVSQEFSFNGVLRAKSSLRKA